MASESGGGKKGKKVALECVNFNMGEEGGRKGGERGEGSRRGSVEDSLYRNNRCEV